MPFRMKSSSTYKIAAAVAVVLASTSQPLKADDAKDAPEARHGGHDARSALESCFGAVEAGNFEAAKSWIQPDSKVRDKLRELNQRLKDYQEIQPGQIAVQGALVYEDVKQALAIVPFYQRSGSVDAVSIQMLAEDGKWRLKQLDNHSPKEAIARLKTFRREHPNCKSSPHAYQVPRPISYKSTFNRDAWKTAAQQAVDYVKANPPKPRSRRPEGLEHVPADDDLAKIALNSFDRLADADSNKRYQAEAVLRYLGPHAMKAWSEAVKSNNPNARRAAISLLWYRPTAEWTDEVLRTMSALLANDPEPNVRTQVLYNCRRLDDDTAIRMITGHALDDQDISVFTQAVQQLGERRDRSAFMPLMVALQKANNWQWRQPVMQALLQVDHAAAWPLVVEIAENETDDGRRFQCLRMASSTPSNSTTYYEHWPKELASVESLVRNAFTIVGEKYQEKELQKIAGQLGSQNAYVRNECARALGHLHATSTVSTLIEHARESKNATVYHRALMTIGTLEAIEFLVDEFRDAEPKKRYWLVDQFQQSEAKRWAVPLLIAMLDDRGLQVDSREPLRGHHEVDFAYHRAHTSLYCLLSAYGFKTQSKNLAQGGKFDLDAEIRRLKNWWANHGKEFLQHKPVPEPTITSVYFAS